MRDAVAILGVVLVGNASLGDDFRSARQLAAFIMSSGPPKPPQGRFPPKQIEAES